MKLYNRIKYKVVEVTVSLKSEKELIAKILEGIKEYLVRPLESDRNHKGHDLNNLVNDDLLRVYE